MVFGKMTEDSYFKTIRKQMRLSQVEMADRMGVARGTLVNLEDGKTEVVTASVLKFCRATGISLLEVMEALFPEFCGDLLKEETQHKEILRQTVDEYEARLSEKNQEIERQKAEAAKPQYREPQGAAPATKKTSKAKKTIAGTVAAAAATAAISSVSRSAGTAVANAVTGKKKSKNSKSTAEKAIGSATSSALRTLTRSILGSLIK